MQNTKEFIFVVLFMFLCSIASSKDVVIDNDVDVDSIRGVWKDDNQPDSNRMKSGSILGFFHIDNDPDSSLIVADQVLTLAERINNKKYQGWGFYIMGRAMHIGLDLDGAKEMFLIGLMFFEESGYQKGVVECWVDIGNICYAQGDFLSALQYYKKAMEVFLKDEDSKGASKMYNSMANIFKSQGDYTRAIEFYRNSVSQAKIAKDDGSMAYANFNMASVFVDLEQYNKALDYAQSSLDYFKKIGLESNIASCYNLMGVISRTNGDHKGAFEYFMRAMQISKSNNFKDALSGAYVNIGDYFKYQGDYVTAMDQYQKSLRFYKELDYRVGVSKVLAKMGNLCNIENKHDQARKYCLNGLQIAEEIGVMVQERDNCLCLSTASVGIGKDKNGLELKKRYVLLRDSLKNMDIQRESVRIDGQVAYNRYILEQKLEKDKEIALTALQNEKRQFVIYCLSGGGAILALLALILFNRFQIVRKTRFKIESLKSLLVMIQDKAPEDQKKLIQLEFEN